ncbi:MAG: hypothetical protein ACREU6_11170 [Steroidobacteraceae bacterium]
MRERFPQLFHGSQGHTTLTGLPLRYRNPYTARHTSVSWNLMLGRSPLWVVKQHGHRVATMLSVYAAWVGGARECDVAAVCHAMGYERALRAPEPRGQGTAHSASSSPGDVPGESSFLGDAFTGMGTQCRRATMRVRVDLPMLEIPDLEGGIPVPVQPGTRHGQIAKPRLT